MASSSSQLKPVEAIKTSFNHEINLSVIPIHKVVVYNSRAAILRKFSITLPPCNTSSIHVLQVKNLPKSVLDESINVRGFHPRVAASFLEINFSANDDALANALKEESERVKEQRKVLEQVEAALSEITRKVEVTKAKFASLSKISTSLLEFPSARYRIAREDEEEYNEEAAHKETEESIALFNTLLSKESLQLLEQCMSNFGDTADSTEKEVNKLQKEREQIAEQRLKEKVKLETMKQEDEMEIRKKYSKDKKHANILIQAPPVEQQEEMNFELYYTALGCTWKSLYDLKILSIQTAEEKKLPVQHQQVSRKSSIKAPVSPRSTQSEVGLSQKKPNNIELMYMADITQSTGEDWNDVEIALSTVDPSLSSHPKQLDPYTVYFTSKKPERGFIMNLFSSLASIGQREAAEDIGKAVRTTRETAEVTSEQGSAYFFFDLKNLKCTIPSDNAPHKTVIGKLALQGTFNHETIPRQGSEIFLKVDSINNSNTPLLKGSLNVYQVSQGNNMNFVCYSKIPTDINPGEKFSLFLGQDAQNFKVEYGPVNRVTKVSGAKERCTISRVLNFHKLNNEDIAKLSVVTIKDQFPISTHQNIKVDVIQPQIKPKEKLQDVEVELISTHDVNPISSTNYYSSKPPAKQQVKKFKVSDVEADENGIICWKLQMGNAKQIKVAFKYVVEYLASNRPPIEDL